MTSTTFQPSQLSAIFAFNPTFGPTEETEHEKVLYYYPPEAPMGKKQSFIGLCEAFINFSSYGIFHYCGTPITTIDRNFSRRPCEVVHMLKHKYALLQPEPSYWLVLAVQNPSQIVKTKEGDTAIEWLENDLDDIALSTVVQQAYKMFKLFNGPFSRIVQTTGVESLRQRLASFVPQWILTVDFDRLDLFTTLNGIRFLPVDKNVFQRIQCLINHIENSFSAIQNSCFLYKDLLVWSGLEQDDMRVLYSFISKHLVQTTEEPAGSDGGAAKGRAVLNTPNFQLFFRRNKGAEGFITGPEELRERSNIHAPRVFLGPLSEEHSLIIYSLSGITCLFMLNPSVAVDIAWFEALHTFVSSELALLAPIIAEHHSRKQGYEDTYKLIYFNHMNLALKATISQQKGFSINRETMKILNDMHADFEKCADNVSEITVKTASERWVVGRKSDRREFYVIIDQRNAGLAEIAEEVRKLSSTFFHNIFID